MVGPHEIDNAHSKSVALLDHQQRVVNNTLITQKICIILERPDGLIIDRLLQHIGPASLVDDEVSVQAGIGLVACCGQPIHL